MVQVRVLAVLLSFLAFSYASDLFEPRLIGSKDSDEKVHVYHVAIALKLPILSEMNIGSGALVANNWVLTSGQVASKLYCGPFHFMCSVKAGLRRLRDVPVQEEGIAKIVIHEFYHGVQGDNDLALIKIKGAGFIKNEFVNFLALPSNEPPEGGHVVVTGWHVAGKDNKPLQEVTVDIKNRNDCEIALSTDYLVDVDFTNFCVENTASRAVCWNDGGAPAVAVNGEEKFLAGIFSWTPKPDKYDLCNSLPAVFTNVAAYSKWINNNMKF